LTGFTLPKDLPDFWGTTSINSVRTALQLGNSYALPFPYSSALYLSIAAKINAKKYIENGSGRVLGGGVCLASKLHKSVNKPNYRSNASADWILFEKGLVVESATFSSGLLNYADIENIEIVRKGVKFFVSPKFFDARVNINLRNKKFDKITIQCNAMGMTAFLQTLYCCV
jgi:hypothetical protein